MNILVRPALEGDVNDLCDLLEHLFTIEQDHRVDRDRQMRGLRTLLDGRSAVVLVACEQQPMPDQGRIPVLGMISVQSLISTVQGGLVGMVEDLVVRDGYRKQGIGRHLLRAAEDWARGRGLSRLQLLADQNNAPALAFYDSKGWQATSLVCRQRMLG